MRASRPTTEARSAPTLTCSTGAIVLREGAGAVGSTYVHDSASCETATPTLTTAVTPTISEREVVLRQPIPAPAALALAATRARPAGGKRVLPWAVASAFAIGAALAAFAGLAMDQGALEVAAGASLLAGTVTLTAGMSRSPNRRWRSGRRRKRSASGGSGGSSERDERLARPKA